MNTASSNTRRTFLSTALIAFAVVIIGACDSVSLLWRKPVIMNCPEHRVLADAASLVTFRDGPGRDLVDVDVEGQLIGMRLGCQTDMEKGDKSGNLEVEATVLFGASRGPANRTRKGVLTYFLRVTDTNDRILYGENFKILAVFPGNQTRARFRADIITLELPIKIADDGKSWEWSNRDYVIWTGFALSREQLKFNRTRRSSVRH